MTVCIVLVSRGFPNLLTLSVQTGVLGVPHTRSYTAYIQAYYSVAAKLSDVREYKAVAMYVCL